MKEDNEQNSAEINSEIILMKSYCGVIIKFSPFTQWSTLKIKEKLELKH
jgi:hypothetical protein